VTRDNTGTQVRTIVGRAATKSRPDDLSGPPKLSEVVDSFELATAPRERRREVLVEHMFYRLASQHAARGMSKAWVEVSAAMPLGWHLEGVIRTPAGVWQAMAASAHGERMHAEGDNEIAALNALVRGLATLRGSMSG